MATIFTGPVFSKTKVSDGGIWMPATLGDFYTGTWTNTRIAAGDYCLRKTAGDEAGIAAFHIDAHLLQRIGADPGLAIAADFARDIRGVQVLSIDLVYQITALALDAHTYDLHEVTYANNTAAALVSTVGGTITGTLAVATQANPYVTRITLGTPWVIGQNVGLKSCVLEVSWDAGATSVLSYYGAYVNCAYNLL